MDKFLFNFQKNLKDKNCLTDWEKYSLVFGKQYLLDLFTSAKNLMVASNSDLYTSFGDHVVNKLIEDKSIELVQKNGYRSLGKIFSEYISFSDNYQERIAAITQNNFPKSNTTKAQIKGQISNNLDNNDPKNIDDDYDTRYKRGKNGQMEINFDKCKQLEIKF